jgi:hypothetical protein
MSFAKVASVVFYLFGVLLCLLAIIAGGVSATSLLERIQHGRGIMFADVEFFALAALAFLVPGLTLLFVAKHLSGRASRGKSESTV